MHRQNLSGVGVTDDVPGGPLVANLSLSDLRGLTPERCVRSSAALDSQHARWCDAARASYSQAGIHRPLPSILLSLPDPAGLVRWRCRWGRSCCCRRRAPSSGRSASPTSCPRRSRYCGLVLRVPARHRPPLWCMASLQSHDCSTPSHAKLCLPAAATAAAGGPLGRGAGGSAAGQLRRRGDAAQRAHPAAQPQQAPGVRGGRRRATPGRGDAHRCHHRPTFDKDDVRGQPPLGQLALEEAQDGLFRRRLRVWVWGWGARERWNSHQHPQLHISLPRQLAP